jgi:PHD/YefM family antitoxin component YafN of YafNO toxin-antitoxin module
MKTVPLSTARQKLFALRAEAIHSSTPITLTHKDGNVVLMSEDDYCNLLEHLHILKDNVTIKALQQAIMEHKNSKKQYKEVGELLDGLEV